MTDFTAWIEKNKAIWTRVYDEVIAPDLEEEWQKRDAAHREELRKREENRLIMFKRFEDEAVKNAQLAMENQELKNQLEKSTRDKTSSHDPVSKPANEPSKPQEEDDRLADKYNELNKKYQDLEQQIKYLRRKNNTVMQKNKDMKESVRSWQEYADRQTAKQKPKHDSKAEDHQVRLSAIPQIEDSRPHVPSSPRSVATVRTPLFPADHARSSPTPMPPLGPLDHEDEEDLTALDRYHAPDTEGDRESITPKAHGSRRSRDLGKSPMYDLPSGISSSTLRGEQVARRSHSHLQATHPSSSQTTVEETGDLSPRLSQSNLSAHDDDVPQFVSARSVNKRKRGQPSRIEIYGDRSDGTPIKPFRVKEETGSSPPNAYSLLRKDTVDLDAPATGLLQTPHHRRHQRSSSAPFSQHTNQGREPAFSLTTREPEVDSDSRAFSEPSDTTNNVSNEVLRDIDPNLVTEPQEPQSNKRVKMSGAHGQSAYRILSESGEEPPPTDENGLRLPPSAARARLNRKLHTTTGPLPHLLTFCQVPLPSPTRIKAEPQPIAAPGSIRPMQTPATTKSRSREPPNTSTVDRPRWEMKAPEPRAGVRKPPISLLGKQIRLRAKPVEELKPADFKVNPAYNQGYSYAFSETVRKRGDRACLPGCTNPQCCGSKFRAFAEAQAPLPASQEEALLEDYLGEAYDNMNLTQMASDERQELVLQARAKKMAKDSGKHREAYERRRTPPGFWRIDFPSTQEQEEDRQKAKELEKELVRERWLETQRKGGKWIFRDE